MFTPPTSTRLNCRVASLRRRRCILGLTGEATFSALKRLKNDLRTTLTQSGMTALSLLYIENDIDGYVKQHRRKRRGVGAEGGARAPLKFGKKISGNFYVKFGHFSGKNHVKLGNFVNFVWQVS